MLVSPQEVLDAQHYDSEELPFVTRLTLGAEAFLRNAGAYREQMNDCGSKVVLFSVCSCISKKGFSTEN